MNIQQQSQEVNPLLVALKQELEAEFAANGVIYITSVRHLKRADHKIGVVFPVTPSIAMRMIVAQTHERSSEAAVALYHQQLRERADECKRKEAEAKLAQQPIAISNGPSATETLLAAQLAESQRQVADLNAKFELLMANLSQQPSPAAKGGKNTPSAA